MGDKKKKTFGILDVLEKVQAELERFGVAVDISGSDTSCCEDQPEKGSRVKVVCVAPGIRTSVEELGKSNRDQVVMVRVDKETSDALDAWVSTGAVKSRSEAAALFVREGLKVRADELAKLKDALGDLEAARERLRKQAREVFGESGDDER